jgi:hypothetical protein
MSSGLRTATGYAPGDPMLDRQAKMTFDQDVERG